MSLRAFLTPEAKDAVRRAVEDAESFTSAEIVVTVRRSSGRYREADYLFGFLVALLALLALLYLPQVFPLWVFAPDVAVCFALGALAGSRSPTLQRWLTPRSVRLQNARGAARTAFVDGGYSRLPGRNAVLVYVALLERHVEVVADLGIRVDALEPGWRATAEALAGTLRPRPDLERFLAALRRLGALLGRAHPRLPGDVNELPDEVSA